MINLQDVLDWLEKFFMATMATHPALILVGFPLLFFIQVVRRRTHGKQAEESPPVVRRKGFFSLIATIETAVFCDDDKELAMKTLKTLRRKSEEEFNLAVREYDLLLNYIELLEEYLLTINGAKKKKLRKKIRGVKRNLRIEAKGQQRKTR